MTTQDGSPHDGAPVDRARIEIQVAEIGQLFNPLDPLPLRERDLDPKTDAFIVESAGELNPRAPLGLVVHLTHPAGASEDLAALPQAVREHFAHRAAATRVQLRRLMRTGWWSLLLGLAFVAAANLIGDAVGDLVGRFKYGRFLHYSIVIGAWVALWRPLEILLYDWWPILAEARLLDRLGAMTVEVRVGPQSRRTG